MASPADLRSAYVHIPFCARVCPYCDFAVVAGRDDSVDRYLNALTKEIRHARSWEPLDAVAFGGGTPSRVSNLGSVVAALRDRFGIVDDAEIGLEANPEDWSDELAAALIEAGFTRVSFGVQSFDPSVLTSLGRVHLPSDVSQAVDSARSVGFNSVSVDLIYGTPGESMTSWENSVVSAVALCVDHVSTYALTVEKSTALGRAVRNGAPAPDPDDQADKWERAGQILSTARLRRYEVSNHARPGHECRYNLSVWHQGEYLAFGVAAHGFRDGVRTRNVRRLDTYLERVEKGVGPVQASDRIEGWSAEQERLMLGLRLVDGVVAGPGGDALVASDWGQRLVQAGVVDLVDTSGQPDRLIVRRAMLTDEVVRAVLDLEEPITV